MDHDEFDRSVNGYVNDLVLESEDVEDFLGGLARLSASTLSRPGVEVLGGVTLRRHKKAGTVASSSERARRLDEIQYNYPDGPCLTASREKILVHVPDLRVESRWPEYTPVALEHGVRSVLALPFDVEDQVSAGLNLYADEPDAFDADAIEAAEAYVRQTSQALRMAVRFAHHHETESNLKAAMESRTTIDIAVGIMMAQSRCSQEEAVNILKSASSSRNIKLRDVAAGIVDSFAKSGTSTHFEK